MTDRYVTLTVLLDKDYRSDDAEKIIEAIKMIRGVMDVMPQVADPMATWQKECAKRELGDQIWDVLYPKKAQ